MLTPERIKEIAVEQSCKPDEFHDAGDIAYAITLALRILSASGLVVVDLAELEAALKGMLAHSCVADSSPNDKAPEDHEAERKARALLTALTKEKTDAEG